MPVPLSSTVYGEWTEPPPEQEPPLEARKVHFSWSHIPCSWPRCAHLDSQDGEWTVRDPDGVDVPTYAFRYDMINGGRRAETDTEADIEYYVETLVRVKGKFKGWQVV